MCVLESIRLFISIDFLYRFTREIRPHYWKDLHLFDFSMLRMFISLLGNGHQVQE